MWENMSLNLKPGPVCMSYGTRTPKSYNSVSSGIPRLLSKNVSTCTRSSLAPCQIKMSCSYKGTQQLSCLSSSSSLLLCGELGSLSHTVPKVASRRKLASSPRAAKDIPFSFRYPPMTRKPRWWWRTLSCLPYLLPLHETWMYAETAYHFYDFLEAFQFYTYPFLRCLGRMPRWFLIAYLFVGYLGIVRRKEWPHFLRFNIVMGMLLEIGLQIVGSVSKRMPRSLYWGKFGMHFWTAVCLAYLFTVLGCIWCAINGMYADVPFFCDAAYIQVPYD